ncbi:MAG: PorT family protein [Flavobacteriales bacterium]|nr:PorT family protein [Flavobacteriales bacterium]
MHKRIVLIALLLTIVSGAFAQGVKMKNLPSFDYKKYHFGFLLSTNSSDFFFDYRPDFTFQDSLLGIENVRQSGFNLALLASLDLTPNFHLRFIPGLSFQDRGLNYRFLLEDGTQDVLLKRTESVFLDFPLLIKLRTNRVGNVAAYALIGGKYSIDLQSQKDVDNAVESDVIIKLQNRDYSIDAGGGIDFFLPYFKFSIEMKTAFGLPNMLIQEDSRFSSPIESLRTRTFIFSLCFEG